MCCCYFVKWCSCFSYFVQVLKYFHFLFSSFNVTSSGLSFSSDAFPSLIAFSKLSSMMFTLQIFLHNHINFLISSSFLSSVLPFFDSRSSNMMILFCLFYHSFSSFTLPSNDFSINLTVLFSTKSVTSIHDPPLWLLSFTFFLSLPQVLPLFLWFFKLCGFYFLR